MFRNAKNKFFQKKSEKKTGPKWDRYQTDRQTEAPTGWVLGGFSFVTTLAKIEDIFSDNTTKHVVQVGFLVLVFLNHVIETNL